MSIRDHRANLTFTVTLENLSLEDAGIYKCVVDRPYIIGFSRVSDPSLGIASSFKVVVSMVPGKPPSCPDILCPGLSFPHEIRNPDTIPW